MQSSPKAKRRIYSLTYPLHCIKCQNFSYLPNVENWLKRKVSAKFWAKRPNLRGKCVFPQHYHTWKIDEIIIFYIVFFESHTALKVSKHVVFSDPYFPAFELNTDRYEVSLRIQSKCETMWTRQSSVFGQISHNDSDSDLFTFL